MMGHNFLNLIQQKTESYDISTRCISNSYSNSYFFGLAAKVSRALETLLSVTDHRSLGLSQCFYANSFYFVISAANFVTRFSDFSDLCYFPQKRAASSANEHKVGQDLATLHRE